MKASQKPSCAQRRGRSVWAAWRGWRGWRGWRALHALRAWDAPAVHLWKRVSGAAAACSGFARAALLRVGRCVLDELYPSHCELCLNEARHARVLCVECEAGVGALANVAPGMCRCCSRLFWGEQPAPERCSQCLRLRPAFGTAVAVQRFRGAVRELIHRFKYGRRLHLRRLFGEWLEQGLCDVRLRDPPVDVLVAVPAHWWRRACRGHNQAQVLAHELARRTGMEVLEVLSRPGWGRSQTRLGRKGRRANMRRAFALKADGEARIRGRHVLLVDDVLTTGATLDACARELRRAGAASVRALVLARG